MDDIDALAEAYVQREVLNYLNDCRGAGDTLAGVLCWWLERQRRRLGKTVVRSALGKLVERGAIEKHRLPGGDIFYQAVSRPLQSQQQE